jgi:hypothetical protein
VDITSGDVGLYNTGSELVQVPVRYGTVQVGASCDKDLLVPVR